MERIKQIQIWIPDLEISQKPNTNLIISSFLVFSGLQVLLLDVFFLKATACGLVCCFLKMYDEKKHSKLMLLLLDKPLKGFHQV